MWLQSNIIPVTNSLAEGSDMVVHGVRDFEITNLDVDS